MVIALLTSHLQNQVNKPPLDRSTLLLLLWCGVAGSVAFLAADVCSGVLAASASSARSTSITSTVNDVHPYSFRYNSISELFIPSAPPLARLVGITLMSLSDLLGIAFGLGVSQVTLARRRKYKMQHHRLHQGGLGLALASGCNLLSATLFPQDIRGTPLTFSGGMHLILLAISVLFSLSVLWNMAHAIPSRRRRRPGFQQYTYVTTICMLTGAILTPRLESHGMLGLSERCSAYSFVIWQAVLAMVLIFRYYYYGTSSIHSTNVNNTSNNNNNNNKWS